MAYPEVNQERYSLLGGLNNKISRYLTGQQEMIRLVNYDFSIPGSLTKRPDTSQFVGTSFGSGIQTTYEHTYRNGASYLFIFGFTGAFYSGSTTSAILGGYSSAIVGVTGDLVGGVTGAQVDCISTLNSLWAANIPLKNFGGQPYTDYKRYQATYGFFVNAMMQVPTFINFGATYVSYGPGSFFASGNGYRYSLAFMNERGVIGPATPIVWRQGIYNQGATQVLLYPPGGLLSGFITKAYANGITMLMFRETIGATEFALRQEAVAITTAVFAMPATAGLTRVIDDGTVGCTYLLTPELAAQARINDYWPLSITGPTTPINFVSTEGGSKNTGAPRFVSVFNSMSIYAGFSYFPSHFFYSELDTPEWVANDSFAEVGTDDGDTISGLITYNDSVILGKYQSLHEITGTNPENVSRQVQTTQYGFMNNFSQCVFNNQLWFLDGQGKGIGQYNGANTEIISTKVEDIFKRINLSAARNTAWMLHVKQRNEVWAGIPVDGSTIVNTIVVFDYVANAWTTFEGLSPNSVTIAKGSLTLPAAVMGFSNGEVRYMNATFTGAQAVTTAVRFPFVNNFGWSTTQVFRWLFLDVDPVVGATHRFNANFYLDAGNAIALTRGITTTTYQTRTDFGLPGKGLSIELIEGSTLPLRINGYTVASRFQRQV